MKKLPLSGLLFFLLSATTAFSQNKEGIQFFKGTWEEANAKAKEEHKLIFLDGYTQWCGPCKVLAKDVFTQKEVGDYFNTHFINVSMDMETPLGRELMKSYNVNQFPSLLYLKPGGYKVDGQTGLQKPEELIQHAKDAMVLRDTVTMDELFDEGGYKDTAFLRRYFYYAYNTSYYKPQEALNKVIARKGYEAMCLPEYWTWVGVAATGEKAGLYFTSHYTLFQQKYGEEAVMNKIADMYFYIRRLNMYREEFKKDSTVYTGFKKRMADRQLPELPFFSAMADFYAACQSNNIDKGIAIANAALKNGKGWQYYQLARLADWMFIADKAHRHIAAEWAARAEQLVKDASLKQACTVVRNDLLNEAGPTVIPSPKIYDVNL